MSRYRKIEVRTWSDEKFRALSGIPPSGQGLWFFLLTGPHTTAIPGLFRAGRAGMAEELGWDIEAFDKAFHEVYEKGMAKADFKDRLVWLPKAIQHNKPESPNVVRGWRVEIDLLPDCDLKREALAGIRQALMEIGPAYVEAFDELFSKASVDKPEKASRKPSAKALANQEQEQEQEQEQKRARESAYADLSPATATPPPEDAEDDNGEQGVPKCPVRRIVALYHEELPELPPVHELPEQTVRMIRQRWRSSPERQTLDWWRGFFEYIRRCPFLMGEKTDFTADLLWIVRPTNFAKIVNGNYEERAA